LVTATGAWQVGVPFRHTAHDLSSTCSPILDVFPDATAPDREVGGDFLADVCPGGTAVP
jgi:hypothetical protein